MSFLEFLLDILADIAYAVPVDAVDALHKSRRRRIYILLLVAIVIVLGFFVAAYLNAIGIW